MSSPPKALRTALADRYLLEGELGAGGMATVYQARDLRHDRLVAVKVLRPELAASLGPERFLAEIRTTARLQHPHIVPLFDSGEAGGFLYYVMPFIEGESLRARLDREKCLGVEAVLAVARPVAQALAYAHDAGIVHRDIKPENILLARGETLVADFGIARALTVAGTEHLTATGVAVGTPVYMSPEQALGEAVLDGRSDVYSLGCVIYEMLAGAPPFTGPSAQAMLARRLSGPPPKLSNVPGAVDEVVRRSLATSPQDRFATTLALADALVKAAREPVRPDLSIVVLPFENLSPDPDNAYLGDGLTEELIADLSKLGALQVISRTSAQRYRGTDKRLPQIAAELGARYVLEGSVRRAGQSLRITAQLIDSRTDAHLWAEKYAGTLDDVFDMQEKVSEAIVRELEVRLTPGEKKQLKHRAIPNAEVYADWLRARQLVRNYTTVGLAEAADRLEAGLRRVGDNASVMAGLAFVCIHKAMLGEDPITEMDRSQAWAERALAVDPFIAQAHLSLGILWILRGRPDRALKHLKSAATSDPGDWDTHQWLAYLYCGVGRHKEALVHARALKALDPGETLGDFYFMWALLYDGRTEEAVALWESAEIDLQIPHRRWGDAFFHAWLGHREVALERLEPVKPLESYDYMIQLSLLLRDALNGDAESFRQHLIPKLVQSVEADAWGACTVAECYCILGLADQALHWLDRAASWGWFNYPLFARTNPFFEPLRADPRYQAFLKRVKVQWEQFEA